MCSFFLSFFSFFFFFFLGGGLGWGSCGNAADIIEIGAVVTEYASYVACHLPWSLLSARGMAAVFWG